MQTPTFALERSTFVDAAAESAIEAASVDVVVTVDVSDVAAGAVLAVLPDAELPQPASNVTVIAATVKILIAFFINL
jgi:hypothetical protein